VVRRTGNKSSREIRKRVIKITKRRMKMITAIEATNWLNFRLLKFDDIKAVEVIAGENGEGKSDDCSGRGR
jgi:recombinational DNA repair ATPase RecF